MRALAFTALLTGCVAEPSRGLTDARLPDAPIAAADAACGGLHIHVVCDDQNFQDWAWDGVPTITFPGGPAAVCDHNDTGSTDFYYPWPAFVHPGDVGTIDYVSSGDFCIATGAGSFVAAPGTDQLVDLGAHCAMQGDAAP